MKYFEYRRYKFKLKIYKTLAIVAGVGLLCLYLKLSQMGVTPEQMVHFIYIFCFIAIALLLGIRFGSKEIKRRRYLNSPLSAVDRMSGEEFEKYLKAHFEKLGYKVKNVGGTGDFGADLVCRKDNETTIVQAKRYRDHRVGIEAVQQIAAARAYYKADKLMVITNSFYTNAAKELAKSNNVELWDRHSLNKFFINHEDKDGVKHEREASIENTG